MKPEDYSRVCEALRMLLWHYDRFSLTVVHWNTVRDELRQVEKKEAQELYEALLKATPRTRAKVMHGAAQYAAKGKAK